MAPHSLASPRLTLLPCLDADTVKRGYRLYRSTLILSLRRKTRHQQQRHWRCFVCSSSSSPPASMDAGHCPATRGSVPSHKLLRSRSCTPPPQQRHQQPPPRRCRDSAPVSASWESWHGFDEGCGGVVKLMGPVWVVSCDGGLGSAEQSKGRLGVERERQLKGGEVRRRVQLSAIEPF
jgi:hypothetical protein